MNSITRRLLPVLAVTAVMAAGCSNPAPTAFPKRTPMPTATPTASASPTGLVVTMWHTATTDPGKSIWDTAASMFMSEHPGVTIQIQAMDEATLDKRLSGVEVTGEVPDLIASAGGARLADLAQKGLLTDISSSVAAWVSPASSDIDGMNLYAVDGKQYGAPWAMGATAFFYNKDLFTRAGVQPPTTWAQFLTVIDKIRSLNVVPMAIAGRDEWPAMNLWSYLLLREAGSVAYSSMIATNNWNNDYCTKASNDLAALVAKSPFEPGYLNAIYDSGEAAWLGNGTAAIDLAGEWAPAEQQVNSTSGKGIGDALGVFAFPTVDGGAGAAGDAIGSPSGFIVGKHASQTAIDFLHFLLSRTVEDEIGASGLGLPTVESSIQTVTDPGLRELMEARDQSRSVQLYLNLVTTPDLTKAIEDAVALLLAGRATAAQTCQAIAAASSK